ncbi:MAG: CopG family transcriptional regulator [Nocardioidaceae bacterium]|nr:ribbon-helix-helix domain-containing protein [Nocardioidaceae bacterium]
MKAQVRRPDGSAVEAVISNVDLDQEVVLRADGSRYTEAAAIADAEEISARRRAPGGGRRSLEGKSGRSPQIGVRLPNDLKRRLAERAIRDGVRESDVVREALEEFLTA